MERGEHGEKEISVEHMEDEDEEEMDQTTINIGSAPTPVIVSVSPNVDFEPERHTSPRHSPISGQPVASDQRLLVNRAHLQVRQTLSEPGRNARVHRPKVSRLSPTRLSPIQPRKYDLSKTLSMGAALDSTSAGPVLWKPVESTGQRISSIAGTSLGVESMQQESSVATAGGSDDSPSTTPSTSPRSMGGSSPVVSTAAGFRMPFLTTQMPTQEQLEALYKTIPASQDQLEVMQKQMMAFLEQQQKAAAALGLVTSSAGGGTSVGGASTVAPPTTTEMFQFPLVFALGVPATAAPSPLTQMQTSSGTSSATPSPTPSNSSTDSGISGISLMSGFSGFPQTAGLSTGAANLATRDTLSLGVHQRRPLSESLSAPGFQQQQSGSAAVGALNTDLTQQYETLLRQFNVQNQQLLLQGHHLQQHYLEQQQRLVQQALLERKQFEEQQRQLAAMHLRQQQELQKKQQVLRQMQEAQVTNLQRQQLLLYHQSLQQQQRFAHVQAAQVQQQQQQPLHKPAVRRASAKETVSLPFPKSALSAQGSNSSINSLHEATISGSGGGGGPSEMSSLSIDTMRASNRSPSLTPKASLTPTNSYESTASNNGRSSPHVGVASPSSGQEVHGGTGLVYDTMMLKHSCSCGGSHAEHPGRLQSIWARLHETRVIMSCKRLKARKASMAELQSIHSENHVRLYARPTQRKPGVEKKDSGRAFIQLSCGGMGVDRDTYWNEHHTSNTARMAAGSVIELADKVVSGEVKNGFAFVRPPGHHALPNQAMAFCYFNNVALAAKAMLSKSKKVCVVDWDIHHGNGTQHIFYDNPGVLYISVHRYDNGTFFPGTGRPEEIGSGAGLGFNVNIAFSGSQNYQGLSVSNFGDAEYLAAFRSIVIPICREFDPDIILVSAGFNATEGHPPTLGGYSVSPKCFAVMTRMLMTVGSGRVAMALEGGYELMSLCASAEGCMRALLGLDLPQLDTSAVDRPPQAPAVASMEKTIAFHKNYWRCLIRSASLLPLSHTEAEKREMEEADTVSALASLSVGGEPQHRSAAMQTAV